MDSIMLTCIDHQPHFPRSCVISVLHEFLEDGGAGWVVAQDFANAGGEVDL